MSLLAVCPAIAGCGGGSKSSAANGSSSAATSAMTSSATASTAASSTAASTHPPEHTERPALQSIGIFVSGLETGYRLPLVYTCKGADRPLSLRWNGIPRGTVELLIFVADAQSVHGLPFFDWAIAGLEPTSGSIHDGKLPPGAVVGRNSFGQVGYSICPEKGLVRSTYIVKMIALTHHLAVQPGFNEDALFEEAERKAKFVGLAGVRIEP
jgi:phosphatidylethanolamine-binding protein (PEBP) family uncharacterized protein